MLKNCFKSHFLLSKWYFSSSYKRQIPNFSFFLCYKNHVFSFLFVNFDLKIQFQPRNCLYVFILQKKQSQHVPSNTHGVQQNNNYLPFTILYEQMNLHMEFLHVFAMQCNVLNINIVLNKLSKILFYANVVWVSIVSF